MTTIASNQDQATPPIPQARTASRLPLTPQQQMEAIQRVQAQAEQRVELGLKLFKAAQTQTDAHKDVIAKIKTEQQELRDEVHRDVAQSLHSYDQWVGQIDETFTRSIEALEEKIEKLQATWTHTQQRIETMIQRSSQMLQNAPADSQANTLVDHPSSQEAAETTVQVAAPPSEVTDVAQEVSQEQASEPAAEIDTDTDQSQPPQGDMSQAMYTQLLKQLRKSKED